MSGHARACLCGVQPCACFCWRPPHSLDDRTSGLKQCKGWMLEQFCDLSVGQSTCSERTCMTRGTRIQLCFRGGRVSVPLQRICVA